MGKADFHMHTSLNDGTATVREVLDYVRDRTDLDAVAITDHDRLTGSYEAMELANEYPFDVFMGCEITTLHGHLLGLFLDKPIPMWRPLDWTIGKIHEQGGLAIAVHPFSMLTRSIGYRSFDGIMKNASPEIYFDAVETFNPSVAGRTCAAKIDRLNRSRFHLPEVGCSDSHHLEGIGTGYTTFDGKSAHDLKTSVLAGQTKAHGEYWDFLTHRRIAQLKFRRIGRNWARAGRSAVRAVCGG
ncbi:MAG: PHP domain-containing protein [Chloroflexi bacterium]|nr:MAG: PHP domain-containing protein [Chloroflexota bacterium]TME46874.1 MAG: PHP domain-containing protein [Chloroflexota bacterium]